MCPECAADLSDTQLYKQATADDNREPLVQEVIKTFRAWQQVEGPDANCVLSGLLADVHKLAEWKP